MEDDRRGRAAGDSMRRFDRHPEFSGSAHREDRRRTGGGLSADQDEDQAGLGCGRDPAGAVPLSVDQADGRCQFGLHAG